MGSYMLNMKARGLIVCSAKFYIKYGLVRSGSNMLMIEKPYLTSGPKKKRTQSQASVTPSERPSKEARTDSSAGNDSPAVEEKDANTIEVTNRTSFGKTSQPLTLTQNPPPSHQVAHRKMSSLVSSQTPRKSQI